MEKNKDGAVCKLVSQFDLKSNDCEFESHLPQKRKKISDKDFIKFVESSISIREIIIKMNLIPAGGNYATVKKRIKKLNLDTSHHKGQGWNLIRKKNCRPAKPLKEILVKGVHYSSSRLRRRLIKNKILKEICSKCGLGPEWNNEELTLHLEHKNGNNLDNRIENLCILCPNCHSQTSTYCRSKTKD